jgi:mRNA interferase MazF
VVISQGDVWWADLPEPVGSGPGYRRAISRIATVVCVSLTSNTALADVPGNTLLAAEATGLPKDSVANSSQIITLDKELLIERVGKLRRTKLDLVLAGLDVVLGR